MATTGQLIRQPRRTRAEKTKVPALGAAALAGANNAAYDQWVENAWEKRLADGRLPNVEPRIAPCGV